MDYIVEIVIAALALVGTLGGSYTRSGCCLEVCDVRTL